MRSDVLRLGSALLAMTVVAHAESIVLPTVIDATTCTEDDTCEFFFPGAPDAHYEFDVIRSVSRTFHLCGSDPWDSLLAIGNATCGTEVALGDNLCVLYEGGGHPIVRPDNLAPGSYFITIDGFTGEDCGNYTLTAFCSADVNKNGDIDFGDILAILGAWGTECSLCGPDVDLSRTVDFADLLTVLSDWGPCE